MPQGKRFTEADADRLRMFWSAGWNDSQIGRSLGRDVKTIRIHRQRLRLKPNPMSGTSRTRQRRALRAAHARNRDGGFTSFVEKANRQRAAELGWPELHASAATVLFVLLEDGPANSERLRYRIEAFRRRIGWRPFTFTPQHFWKLTGALIRVGFVERDRSGPGSWYSITDRGRESRGFDVERAGPLADNGRNPRTIREIFPPTMKG